MCTHIHTYIHTCIHTHTCIRYTFWNRNIYKINDERSANGSETEVHGGLAGPTDHEVKEPVENEM